MVGDSTLRQGEEEILFRRIGRNAPSMIRACREPTSAPKRNTRREAMMANQRDFLHKDSPANPASKMGCSGRLGPARS